jgi:hypothetical protein
MLVKQPNNQNIYKTEYGEKDISPRGSQKRTLLVQIMDLSTSEKDHIRNFAGHETVITV